MRAQQVKAAVWIYCGAGWGINRELSKEVSMSSWRDRLEESKICIGLYSIELEQLVCGYKLVGSGIVDNMDTYAHWWKKVREHIGQWAPKYQFRYNLAKLGCSLAAPAYLINVHHPLTTQHSNFVFMPAFGYLSIDTISLVTGFTLHH